MQSNVMVRRLARAALLFFIALSCSGLNAPASAQGVDLATPEGALLGLRKVWCDARDGTPAVFHWTGAAYLRIAGAADRKLFDVEGFAVRACARVTDPRRGEGFRLVGREATFALDPRTSAPAADLVSPLMGASTPAQHWIADPVKGDVWRAAADGAPLAWRGVGIEGAFTLTATAPAFDASPAAIAAFGGPYQASEMFSFFGDEAALRDPETTAIPTRFSWFRLLPVPTWLGPAPEGALLYMHAGGGRISGFEALPQRLRDHVLLRMPDFRAPPPLDDPRPAASPVPRATP